MIGLDYRTHAAAEQGWFVSNLTRFDAQGKPLSTLKSHLHVPDLVPFVVDDGPVRDGPWCDHSIVRLRDGSLLAANCGCFAQDKIPVTSYSPQFTAHKYRGFVTRSTDRGLTWVYLSTVTADPDLGSEGCNEMDLIRAPNGDLLCVYRTGADRNWSVATPDDIHERWAECGRLWALNFNAYPDLKYTWAGPHQFFDASRSYSSYLFAWVLALTVYERVQADPASGQKLVSTMKAGFPEEPDVQLRTRLGVDLADPVALQRAFAVVEKRVAQFEQEVETVQKGE